MKVLTWHSGEIVFFLKLHENSFAFLLHPCEKHKEASQFFLIESFHGQSSCMQWRRWLEEDRLQEERVQCRHKKIEVLAFSRKQCLMLMENMTRDSHTLVAPLPKTKTSVKVVTVIETPACFIVLPIFSDRLNSVGEGSSSTLDQQLEITNMSSIPIPKQNWQNLFR